MANNHDSKLKEAQAKQKALNEAGELSEASGWDLIKAGVAKLTNKASEIKENVVSSDPKIREEQKFIREVDNANIRSEAEAVGTAATQHGMKAVNLVYGMAKGVVKGAIPAKPKSDSKKDKPKASNS